MFSRVSFLDSLFLLICFSLICFPASALAASEEEHEVQMVSMSDFRIGVEGSPLQTVARQSLGSPPPPSSVKVTRELVSLYGGEKGTSIPSRGYLSDVVWGEQVIYPGSGAAGNGSGQYAGETSERILYYGFNAGQWKGRLDSETTVLTRAFMTQPLLVFLDDKDKASIATELVQSPFFLQAVQEHKKYVLDSLWLNNHNLDDLLEGLGAYGVSKLTEIQKLNSSQLFKSRVEALDEFSVETGQSGISFKNKRKKFQIFKGMSLSGSRSTKTKREQMNFSSYSSLTYGVQELKKFDNTKGGFWDNVDRHFFKIPLLKSVTGWLDSDLVQETPVGVSSIPALDKVGGSAQIALFRNNPNTPYDAPMATNLVITAAVIMEVGGSAAAVFKPELMKNLMKRVKAVSDKSKPFIEWTALLYTVVKSGKKLFCTSADNKKDGVCQDYSKYLDSVTKLSKPFKPIFSSVENALKAGERGKPFDGESFCGAAIMKALPGRFTGNVRKTALDKSTNNTKLAVCAFNEIATKPLLANFKKYLPEKYKKIKGISSIRLTADFFKRAGWKIDVKGVPAGARLESLVLQLRVANINVKASLKVLVDVMDVGTGMLKFFQDVKAGKVQMLPLLVQLRDALMDHMKDKGHAYLSSAIYDVFKTLTPAKYVQLAYSLGNKGTALAWDWMTDPAVIKLQMNRRTKNDLDISYLIPDMQAVRYLQLPFKSQKLVSHTMTGSYCRGKDDSYVYPLALDGGSNNLLVLPGFVASVENQSAFKKEDKDTIKQLLASGNVELMWDVKKFPSSEAMRDVSVKERKEGDFNYFNKTVKSSMFPWWDPIVGIDKKELLNQQVFGADINGFKAVDFTEIYRNQIGSKKKYPLKHQTPGIYSDYTHIQFTSKVEQKQFANTFSVYVLNNLKSHVRTLNSASRLYREKKAGKFTGEGEVQLKFTKAVNWKNVAGNGLWAVWHSIQNGKNVWSEPVELGNITGGEVVALNFPDDINVGTGELIIYDDILNGYLGRTKLSRNFLLSNVISSFYGESAQGQYPVIRLPLKGLALAGKPLLTPDDRDHDGVPDLVDAFPDDPSWAYDTDGDGMPDDWEKQYDLKVFTKDGDADSDNDGFTNIEEFKAGTNPLDSNEHPLTAPQNLRAVAGDGKVNLSWDAVPNATGYSLCHATETITDINNCTSYTNGGWFEPIVTTQIDLTALTDGQLLIEGQVYYFRLIAQDANGNESPASDEAMLTYHSTENRKLAGLLGASAYARGEAVTSDADGNIYVAGQIGDALFDGSETFGYEDVLVAKYDQDGRRLWTRRVGGGYQDIPYSIEITSENHVIIGGITNSQNFDGHDKHGLSDNTFDAFVVAFDLGGTKLWSALLGGADDDRLTDVSSDESGNVYVVGYSSGNYENIANQGGADVFVTRINSSGSIVWSRLFGGGSDEIPYDVKLGNATLYVTGATHSDGFNSQISDRDYDVFLLKITTAGSQEWVKTIGTEGVDIASVFGHSINIDESGNIRVVGVSGAAYGSTFDGKSLRYGGDYFILEYDSEGRKSASTLLEIGNRSNSYSIFGRDNNVYVTTSNDYNYFEGFTPIGNNDIYVVKFSSEGSKLLTKQFGGTGNDYVAGGVSGAHTNGIFVKSNGSVYLTGHTQNLSGHDQFEGLNNNAASGYDLFFIRYGN